MNHQGFDDGTTGQRRGRERVFLWLGGIAGIVVLYLIGAAVIPRWWAQRVGNVVEGDLTDGALFGLFIGTVFTVVPLLALWAAFRWRSERRTWKGWLGWLALILLLAAPNLMTLGIVLGRNDAAHDGDEILDVRATGFRVWSLVGVIAGVVGVAAVIWLTSSRRRSRRREDEYRDQLRGQDHSR